MDISSTTNWFPAVSAGLSALAAIVSCCVMARQLYVQRKHNALSQQPILSSHLHSHLDVHTQHGYTELLLVNFGNGTALLDSVTVQDENGNTYDVGDLGLTQLIESRLTGIGVTFEGQYFGVLAGESLPLIRFQYISSKTNYIKEKLSGLTIVIHYRSTYGESFKCIETQS